jgi:hypothetical protein
MKISTANVFVVVFGAIPFAVTQESGVDTASLVTQVLVLTARADVFV